MGRGGNWSAAAAERGSVSVFYISLKEDALSFPSGVDYAPPIKETMNVTVLSWVNDTNHSTTSRSTLQSFARQNLWVCCSAEWPARKCL